MTAVTIVDNTDLNNVLKTDDFHLETATEHRKRWLSIRLMYFTVFLMSLGFGIAITGIWPYLHKLDEEAGKEFMGYIIAANPFGQMLFSPLIGLWANKINSTKKPFIFTLVLFIVSNAMYSSLELIDSYRRYWMIATRLLVGISAANIAICRSYLSAATKLQERTGAVSMISLAQVLGFIVGPGLQSLVTPLGDEGFPLIEGKLSMNMYTAAGWINVLLGIINLILFAFFKERPIAAKEAMVLCGATSEKAAWKGLKPDYLSAWTLIVAFFILTLNFVLLETIGVMLTMDQFAWTDKQAVSYLGILLSIGGVLACITMAVLKSISKWINEVLLLLWGGFLLMVIGRAIYIPWGPDPPVIAYVSNATNSTKDILGCPDIQEWCLYTPALTITQFLIGFLLTCVGYPLGITLIQTIFSKVLGPRPQGVWMGWMTGSGCFSRVVGPVMVSYLYTRMGTIWTFGLTTVMMVAAMVWLRIVLRRLQKACLKNYQIDGNEGPSPEMEIVDTTRDS